MPVHHVFSNNFGIYGQIQMHSYALHSVFTGAHSIGKCWIVDTRDSNTGNFFKSGRSFCL